MSFIIIEYEFNILSKESSWWLNINGLIDVVEIVLGC